MPPEVHARARTMLQQFAILTNNARLPGEPSQHCIPSEWMQHVISLRS